MRGIQQLGLTGSRALASSWGSQALELWLAAVAHRLSCSTAFVIFPSQGLNSCPLHWQVDS